MNGRAKGLLFVKEDGSKEGRKKGGGGGKKEENIHTYAWVKMSSSKTWDGTAPHHRKNCQLGQVVIRGVCASPVCLKALTWNQNHRKPEIDVEL